MTRERWKRLSKAREDFALAFYYSKYKPTLRQVGLSLRRGPGDSSHKTGGISVERTRQLIVMAHIRAIWGLVGFI